MKVKHVYERCGFDASSSPTTLYMLSDLEARLEDLLSDIGQMPQDYVAKAEKVYLHLSRIIVSTYVLIIFCFCRYPLSLGSGYSRYIVY